MVIRAALVKDGIVVNATVFADDFAQTEWDGYEVVLSETASTGDLWDGRKFTKPVAEAPTKSRIEELAAKPTLTPADIVEAVKLLLEKAR